MGWRDPFRIRAQARRDCRHGALVFQRLRQHRLGLAAQEARHPSAHRHRADRAHLHRSDRSLRRRATKSDATADYSDEMMHAALDINIPNYASAIVTTSQIIASILAPNVMESVQT